MECESSFSHFIAVERLIIRANILYPGSLNIVSPDVKASYTTIIDSILASSDLTTISEKRIRRGLQETTGHDLTPYKVGGYPRFQGPNPSLYYCQTSKPVLTAA